MKKVFLISLFFCLGVSLAFAEETSAPATTTASTTEVTSASAPVASEITLKGDIIDNMCASSQAMEGLAAFVKIHTKECTLKPACAASGYSIFADGKLYKFDKDSSAKVQEFLNKDDSKLQVTVTAKDNKGELSLISIWNQQ